MDEAFLRPPENLQPPRLKKSGRRRNRVLMLSGWGLLLVGLGFTIVVAVIGVQGSAMAATPAIALTVASGLFQVLSVAVSNNAGKADVNLVRTTVRRLLRLQMRATEARGLAEKGFDEAEKTRYGSTFGLISVNLSQMEDHLVESIETWRDLHPEIFEDE